MTTAARKLRALWRESKLIDAGGVWRYLAAKFGDALTAVRSAPRKPANRFGPGELAQKAYLLYEQFRPSIPEGGRGRGAKGNLDLALIARLAKKEQERSAPY